MLNSLHIILVCKLYVKKHFLEFHLKNKSTRPAGRNVFRRSFFNSVFLNYIFSRGFFNYKFAFYTI
jgi:hypothetical protein